MYDYVSGRLWGWNEIIDILVWFRAFWTIAQRVFTRHLFGLLACGWAVGWIWSDGIKKRMVKIRITLYIYTVRTENLNNLYGGPGAEFFNADGGLGYTRV